MHQKVQVIQVFQTLHENPEHPQDHERQWDQLHPERKLIILVIILLYFIDIINNVEYNP